ncbi:Cystathionine gamma-lyase [Fasciola hepatica]|uniref:cystathionine gamma-lyase n=1 Tax=Fasciola hepatica TaxID=6192 RepID=A0A4E0RHV8_FASHE|nr:Cystathionine gamma-lyase [Fasciola hepatica]
MGAVITKNNLSLQKQLAFLQLAGGAVPSPFDCYLCLRGIRTLAVRMQAHMRSALTVAMMLERHPCVEEVIHPGQILSSTDQHVSQFIIHHAQSNNISMETHRISEQGGNGEAWPPSIVRSERPTTASSELN